jgi:hypothetical protein
METTFNERFAQMASVVFDVSLDEELLENIGSLRALRLEALNKQLTDIDSTLDFLELQGAITQSERVTYRHAVQFEISEKIKMVESRVRDNETVYSDELELYLELLAEPGS